MVAYYIVVSALLIAASFTIQSENNMVVGKAHDKKPCVETQKEKNFRRMIERLSFGKVRIRYE